MAWNTINYSCGHVGRMQLYGHHTERDKKVNWLEREGICPECFLQRKKQEREIEIQNALEKARAENLPELKGSEKQIQWAETIRREALDRLYQKDQIIARCKEETLAKWFIDNRFNF